MIFASERSLTDFIRLWDLFSLSLRGMGYLNWGKGYCNVKEEQGMDFHPLYLNLPPFYPNGNGDCEGNHSCHGDYDGNHRPSFPSESGIHDPC